MPGDTDDVLIRLSSQRDEAALAALYDLRGRLVYSLAYSIVRNARDAEEVTQEVFVRVWQKADTFDRSRGSGLAWLTTITRRLAIDRTRSKHYKSGVTRSVARRAGRRRLGSEHGSCARGKRHHRRRSTRRHRGARSTGRPTPRSYSTIVLRGTLPLQDREPVGYAVGNCEKPAS